MLADIDAHVGDGDRTAWMVDAFQAKLAGLGPAPNPGPELPAARPDPVLTTLRDRDVEDVDIVRRHAAGTAEPGDHPRERCPYPAGCSGCEPDTVQRRAARGEPDAVARMRVAGQLDPGYLTEAGLDHLLDDVDGDIAGADYPAQPEPVPPIAGADITIEVTPVAGGALWRWKVAHPDLDRPIEGSESFRSAILDSAHNIVRGVVGHGDFVLRLPKGVAR